MVTLRLTSLALLLYTLWLTLLKVGLLSYTLGEIVCRPSPNLIGADLVEWRNDEVMLILLKLICLIYGIRESLLILM